MTNKPGEIVGSSQPGQPAVNKTTTTALNGHHSDVQVRLDDRVRLMSALLAATDFPEKAQRRKPHGTHAHARATRKILADYAQHPAVQTTQALLDQSTPLEALFTLALRLSLPDIQLSGEAPTWMPIGYIEKIRDFCTAAQLPAWWQRERSLWEKAETEAQHVFNHVKFREFLIPFLDEVDGQFVFIPNISYPTDHDLGLRHDGALICIAPPPLAWGDNPPWPYDEETMRMHSYRMALSQVGRLLLTDRLHDNRDRLSEAAQEELPLNEQFRTAFPTWEDQFIELFVTALVAMYLEQHMNEAEYKSFVLMERRMRGMNILPGTVSVLRRYLQEKGGSKYSNLMEFLPYFPKQLRVAKRMVNI
jgi:hypothetical protein